MTSLTGRDDDTSRCTATHTSAKGRDFVCSAPAHHVTDGLGHRFVPVEDENHVFADVRSQLVVSLMLNFRFYWSITEEVAGVDCNLCSVGDYDWGYVSSPQVWEKAMAHLLKYHAEEMNLPQNLVLE